MEFIIFERKISEDRLKVRLVKQWLSGSTSLSAFAEEHNLSPETLVRWVEQFRSTASLPRSRKTASFTKLCLVRVSALHDDEARASEEETEKKAPQGVRHVNA